MERIRKNVMKLSKEIGFTIHSYFFVILHSYYHRTQIIKHLLDSIEERLSKNSSNKKVLNSAKPEYKKVVKYSGYKNVNPKDRAQKVHRK